MSVRTVCSNYDSVKAWQEPLYKDLHRHPELSMQEERTLGIIKDELSELGFHQIEVGGGVVGVLENGAGSTVMLRADFDGLPVKEDTGLDYASTDTAVDQEGNAVPVMHACGHDSHVASLLGMGALMAQATDQWSGTLQLIFQPGEEIAAGAQSMVDDGLVDKVATPDVVLGQHVFASNFPAGTVALASGPFMSTAVSMDVKVYGQGSHGSMPHLSVDPVVLASSIVMRLQTVISRELNPSEFGVLTVGAINAGSKANIIPFEANLKINVRAYSEQVRDKITGAIERIVNAECEAAGSPPSSATTIPTRLPATIRTPRSAFRKPSRPTSDPTASLTPSPSPPRRIFPPLPTPSAFPTASGYFPAEKKKRKSPTTALTSPRCSSPLCAPAPKPLSPQR